MSSKISINKNKGRKKLAFGTKLKAMNMFGIPKTQNFEAKPIGDIQKAFIKNLISKKDGFYEKGHDKESMSKNEEITILTEAYQHLIINSTRPNQRRSGRTSAQNWQLAAKRAYTAKGVVGSMGNKKNLEKEIAKRCQQRKDSIDAHRLAQQLVTSGHLEVTHLIDYYNSYPSQSYSAKTRSEKSEKDWRNVSVDSKSYVRLTHRHSPKMEEEFSVDAKPTSYKTNKRMNKSPTFLASKKRSYLSRSCKRPTTVRFEESNPVEIPNPPSSLKSRRSSYSRTAIEEEQLRNVLYMMDLYSDKYNIK